MHEGTILVYCPSNFSLTPPLPKLNVQLHTDNVWLGVGGWGAGGVDSVELCCRPYSAGVLHSVSDQIQNQQYCFTTPNKKRTSKDDIKGLVSLKFHRPWLKMLTEISYFQMFGSHRAGDLHFRSQVGTIKLNISTPSY